jgi:hypothetical protein
VPDNLTGRGPDAPPAGLIVDAVVRAVLDETAPAPDDRKAVLVEAVIARWVVMAEEGLVTPSGAPSPGVRGEFWESVAAELDRRTDPELWPVVAGAARLVAENDRPVLEEVWRRWVNRSEPPGWVEQVGTAQLESAIVTEDLAGDGYNVVLCYDDGADGHTVVVYVDNNLGAIAKDVFPGPERDTVVEAYRGNDDVVTREVSVPGAVGLALAALERTTDEDFTTADYERFQAMLRLRLRGAAVEWPTPVPEMSRRDRLALLAAFLESDHVTELRHPERLVFDVARLWLDHALDETEGGPLRISAVLVELFLADWVPRVVRPQSWEFLDAVPGVVRAWLRFAADETPVPRSLLADALGAIERWAPVMRRRCTDAAAWAVPVPVLAPEPEDDDLEAIWFSLPEIGRAPTPDVTGLDRAMGVKLIELARGAWVLAGERLGTDFAGRAFAIAERLVREAPTLLAGTQLRTWQLAITWLIAEDEDVFHTVRGRGMISAQRWARDLGTTAKTMQARATALRKALDMPMPY